ncbi:hypothetical protein I8752_26155 [Nostocaceae cyanobacterium CENA369]|uniref:Uncharacterized protein n=1 Tax=Dendronalium phyllosphericum CENA369 TaxID=1725256 RepID=A0A8J7LI00_9NOST|nr:hypothetical protein [Dendronalium phyllosphericum]MBH8576409.1 hypothetical protein [Dendronalium phyllosphericum CENA369]
MASKIDGIFCIQESDESSHLTAWLLWASCQVDGFPQHPFCSPDPSQHGIRNFLRVLINLLLIL